MSKGRNTTVVSVRLPDEVIEWLERKSTGSAAEYIKTVILQRYGVPVAKIAESAEAEIDKAEWDSLSDGSKWNRIRHAVFERDRNRCQVCKQVCRRINNKVDNPPRIAKLQRICHHLFWDRQVVPDLSQYITLCSSCHGKLPYPDSVNSGTRTPDVAPWYDPQVHRAGDRVRVRRGQKTLTVTVPALDGAGNPMPW